jgi:hypothetical protein
LISGVTQIVLEAEGLDPGSAINVFSAKETAAQATSSKTPQELAEELFSRIRYDCDLTPTSQSDLSLQPPDVPLLDYLRASTNPLQPFGGLNPAPGNMPSTNADVYNQRTTSDDLPVAEDALELMKISPRSSLSSRSSSPISGAWVDRDREVVSSERKPILNPDIILDEFISAGLISNESKHYAPKKDSTSRDREKPYESRNKKSNHGVLRAQHDVPQAPKATPQSNVTPVGSVMCAPPRVPSLNYRSKNSVWFCSRCGDEPVAEWQDVCVQCRHQKCADCAVDL